MDENRENWADKTVFTGDNLHVMRGMNSESVDLIYLDPPFNSKTDYAAPIGSKAAGAEFKDTWTLSDVDVEWIDLMEDKHPKLWRVLLAAMTGSDKSYLAYMAVRLLEMRRLLKPTGSLYLHCDPTMSHYLKLLLDAIFGRGQFRNEVVWKRTTGRRAARHWGNAHDVLLFYTKSSDDYAFAAQYVALADSARAHYRHKDGRGAYRLSGVNAPGANGYHYDLGHDEKPPSGGYIFPRERALEMLAAGMLVVRKGRVPTRKMYLADSKGTQVNTVQTDIPPVVGANKTERTGYPTQKPLALLRRIIAASSSPGDTVLDPFCGCATTMVAADSMDRSWVGIDVSPKAAELVIERIAGEKGSYPDVIHRTDLPRRTDLGKLPSYKCRANREALYGSQAGHCGGCREHFQMKNLTVDHIIARAKGGTDHIDNLQLLCGHCNSVKGDRGMQYLRSRLQVDVHG